MAADPTLPQPDSGFEVVRKGYDQGQVDAHLRRLDAEIRILSTDRDAAIDQAAQLNRELDDSRARAERLRAQVHTLVSPAQSVQGMSERMRSMLRLAEDEVAEMHVHAETEVSGRIREAEQAAAQILAKAQAEADAVIGQARAEAEATATECARQRADVEAERRASAEATAAATTQAEQERARAWEESQAKCALLEEDFTIAMDQRRSEALAELTAERLAARREIEEMRETAAVKAERAVAEAQEHAAQIVGAAERRVAELTGLRRRILEQLGSTRAVLERSMAGLDPLPTELAERNGTAKDSAKDAPVTTQAGSVDDQPEPADEAASADGPPATGTAHAPAPRRPRPKAAAGRR